MAVPAKPEKEVQKPKIEDQRLGGTDQGRGIANDSYSKSQSSKPQISDARKGQKGNVNADPKAKDMDENKSSGEASHHKGDGDAHSDAARKSKV